MDSNASESARTSRDGSFLSQAGLVTLLLGVTLCALGVFLEHPTAGVVTFAACVVASTAMAAFLRRTTSSRPSRSRSRFRSSSWVAWPVCSVSCRRSSKLFSPSDKPAFKSYVMREQFSLSGCNSYGLNSKVDCAACFTLAGRLAPDADV